jgi:hypothetical protein
METRETTHYTEIQDTKVSRVSWAAVFGGTLIMLITLMLLSLLGIGIGIGSINPMEEARPLQGLGTGALIWWVISNIIAVFAGAYTAAKLTNLSYKYSGLLHGILTWSLYTLISFLLMTSAIGGILTGVGGAVSKSLSVVGSGVSEISSLADQVDTERINRLIQDALTRDEAGGMGSAAEGQEFDIDLIAVVREVFIKDGEINTNINREEVEQAVAQNSTLSERDAQRAANVIIQEYQQIQPQLQQVRQTALETGQQAAEGISRAAIWSFFALVLGLVTAAFAGHLGKPSVRETVRVVR